MNTFIIIKVLSVIELILIKKLNQVIILYKKKLCILCTILNIL